MFGLKQLFALIKTKESRNGVLGTILLLFIAGLITGACVL